MATVSLFLKTVHDTVHVLGKKPSFSEPKIYTGGIDPSEWSKLSKKEKEDALSKDWYVYWSYRDPNTGKLKRQPNIKAGANRMANKRERLAHLRTLSRNLLFLLDKGFDPYSDNTHLLPMFDPANEEIQQQTGIVAPKQDKPVTVDTTISIGTDSGKTTLISAVDDALAFKSHTLSATSFSRFKSRANQFSEWARNKLGNDLAVEDLDRKLAMEYLRTVLERTSARTHNNTKADLSSLFQFFEDNGLITNNFVKGIRSLPTKPNLHRTYSLDQLKMLDNYLASNDPVLLLFVRFVSYAFLRPIEVCRLLVGDIDTVNKLIHVRTKTKQRATKILPDILLEHLPDLSAFDPKSNLFALDSIGGYWDTLEDNKRNHYSKQFKKAKDALGLGKEYGLYSYRHTFITQVYHKLAKKFPPAMAKGKLMLITGHTTMSALEKYLRDINAELPEDYSHLLKELE
ncbi:tyrosine-type recombinase/integrase [Flagellimonas myxillae]|uniref:tyrosine-type recombinase/integrase n=1 Tax=Flagellimonas myxillae TaxID=2942214 RepID=UPI00201EE380|nr:tyrosine-type recombinase/integrase [Muricauda myxillae]MCL6267786.1 site-specific integrase [Muricauda myxillae]